MPLKISAPAALVAVKSLPKETIKRTLTSASAVALRQVQIQKRKQESRRKRLMRVAQLPDVTESLETLVVRELLHWPTISLGAWDVRGLTEMNSMERFLSWTIVLGL